MLGKMDCCGRTDVGRVRDTNEDQFLIADLNKSMRVFQTSLGLDHQTRLFGGSQAKLLLVADGMGGQAAGERASTIAIDTITRYVLNTMDWFFRLDGQHENEFVEELKSSLVAVQREILIETEKIPRRHGMGTTLTMAYLVWPQLYVVHAGDSRCYVQRGTDLRRLTRDHTVAQQFVDGGAMSSAAAENSKWSHMLWNVLGGDSDKLHVELHHAELQMGDMLLLCTDGLSSQVPHDAIARMLSEARSAHAAVERLIDAANKAGGKDNITAVVARFLDSRSSLDAMEAEADLEDTAVYEFSAEERDRMREPAPAEEGSAVRQRFETLPESRFLPFRADLGSQAANPSELRSWPPVPAARWS